MNKVSLEGYLVTEPQKKGEKHPCRFKIKTLSKWRGDEKKENKKTFHKIIIWGELGKKSQKELKKHDKVEIEGSLQYKKQKIHVKDENGNKIIHNGKELEIEIEIAEIKVFKIKKKLN